MPATVPATNEFPYTSDEVIVMLEASEFTPSQFETLYEYYTSNGEMPYGTAKARDGDPHEWIYHRLEEEFVG